MAVLTQQTRYCRKRNLAVCDHSHVGHHVLVYLRPVYIQMYNLCLTRVCCKIARNAVAEAHAYGNEHITLLLLYVWRIIAVHAEHADVERMT